MIEDGRVHYEKFVLEIEKASKHLEATRKELSKREKQLQQRETQFEDEKKKFNKRKRTDEKEALDRKKFELEKKSKAKTLLELEMDSLRFDIEEMERNGNSNKHGEVHDYETGALNAMNMFATPSELRATPLSGWGGGYKAPDTSLETYLRDGVA
ncbi:hypothetical protein Q3G72_009848 [Acer saccharum]|nr:hypothetical protein Q3G72_009848 [Acer saccharum]